MQVTADALRFLTRAYDLDRGASRVAIRGRDAIGLVNLGLRGPDAWIGGLGVVPTARRQGIGRVLMAAVHDEARARGAERVWLECIVENTQALALYEELGYEHVRDVEVWSLDGGDGRSRGVRRGGGTRLDPRPPDGTRALAASGCVAREPGRHARTAGRRRGRRGRGRGRAGRRPPAGG